jgi:hypothetical protein
LPRWDRLCFKWFCRCALRFGTQQRVYGTLPGAYAAFSLVTRGPPAGEHRGDVRHHCTRALLRRVRLLTGGFQIGDELRDRFTGATGHDLVLSGAERNFSAIAALHSPRVWHAPCLAFPSIRLSRSALEAVYHLRNDGVWYHGHFCHQCIINTTASYTNNKTVPKKVEDIQTCSGACQATDGLSPRSP